MVHINKRTSSPMVVSLSCQHMTYKPSKLGQTYLVFFVCDQSSSAGRCVHDYKIIRAAFIVPPWLTHRHTHAHTHTHTHSFWLSILLAEPAELITTELSVVQWRHWGWHLPWGDTRVKKLWLNLQRTVDKQGQKVKRSGVTPSRGVTPEWNQ